MQQTKPNNIYPEKEQVFIKDVFLNSINETFRDKTASESLINQLPWQLEYDCLTGLINGCAFEKILKKALLNAQNFNQKYIFCHIDLDHFQVLNDVYTHVAGYELLCKFSTIIQKNMGINDTLARLGSDEFGLLLHQCNLEQALIILQKMRDEFRQFRFPWQNDFFSITASIGVTILNASSQSTSSVLIEADSACCLAKSKGRDRIQVYQLTDNNLANYKRDSQGFLRILKALEENQFLLFCQPIMPIFDRSRTQECVKHYEVLIRLQDESGNILSPKDFLPTAERYGLMHLIDRWVIKNLFAYLSKTSTSKIAGSYTDDLNYRFSINLSGSSLNDDQFLDFVQEQLSLHSVAPESICFEITETIAVSNLTSAIHVINQLRQMGCRFALDDFGSGMSSFGYLKSFSVDYIKIDGNFVKEMTNNKISYEIVKSINEIGQAMGIETTAEFVENEEILASLITLGVNYAQGYGVAKPRHLELT